MKKLFKTYSLQHEGVEIILSHDTITKIVNQFWHNIFSLNQNRHILLQLRIKTGDRYYSLSKFQIVSFNDTEALTKTLKTPQLKLCRKNGTKV